MGLNQDEVSLLVRLCLDHEVAFCEKCQKAYRLGQLGSDMIGGLRFNRCGVCQTDVQASVRAHLHDCPLIQAALTLENEAMLEKKRMQLVDASQVLIAESQERIQYRLNAGICLACRNVIQPGQGRYRLLEGDYHVHCFEEEKKKPPK
jgi:hypothetical protein